MFRKIQPTRQAGTRKHTFTDTSLVPFATVRELLDTPKRQKFILNIRKLTRLPDKPYAALYTATIDRFAQFVQRLPMPRKAEYDQQGGAIELALERASLSLYEYTEYLKTHGFYPATFSLQQELWNYILFNAALLRDLGKIVGQTKVQIFDAERVYVKQWSPLQDDFTKLKGFYKYSEEDLFPPELYKPLTSVLAQHITPKEGLAWIQEQFESFQMWLDLLLTDDEEARGGLGLLSNLILWANQFLLDPGTGPSGAPTFEQRLVMLLSKQPKESAASKTPTGPRKLPAGGNVPPPAQLEGLALVGLEFMAWLQQAIKHGTFPVNQAGSPVQRVAEGVFLNNAVFELFLKLSEKVPGNVNAHMVRQEVLQHGLASGTEGGSFQAQYQVGDKTQQIQQGLVLENVENVFVTQTPELNANYRLVRPIVNKLPTVIQMLEAHARPTAPSPHLMPGGFPPK